MHVRGLTKARPVAAINIEAALDIILQFINVLEAVERFLGLDLVEKWRQPES